MFRSTNLCIYQWIETPCTSCQFDRHNPVIHKHSRLYVGWRLIVVFDDDDHMMHSWIPRALCRGAFKRSVAPFLRGSAEITWCPTLRQGVCEKSCNNPWRMATRGFPLPRLSQAMLAADFLCTLRYVQYCRNCKIWSWNVQWMFSAEFLLCLIGYNYKAMPPITVASSGQTSLRNIHKGPNA